uniref:Addiction module toxin, HicA family n=1 Tax=Desulfacinum infernum TaxID=35837 RepID=A0A832A1Q6_9BACT
MSVQRRELIPYVERNGYHLMREGAKHAVYTNGIRVIPVKRQKQLDRITANEICKQAGLEPIF